MRALTLHRPWDTAILRLGKPVENRSWPPPSHLIGQRFALHSGKKWDREGAFTVEMLAHKHGIDLDVAHIHISRAAQLDSVILGTVKLARVLSRAQPQLGTPDPLASSPWFFGDYGWVCEDPIPFAQPVPCKGMQGLWTLPPAVEALVLAQEIEFRRGAQAQAKEATNG